MAIAADTLESLAVKFAALLPHLDERQQRLCLGAEARSLGRGGIAAVARAAHVSRQTVADGVAELTKGQVRLGRVRRSGGGRKRLADVDPHLRPALLVLIEPGTVAPTSPLRWTTKSTRRLARELTATGHRIAADTVATLLREEGFRLHSNARTVAQGQQLTRGEQFRQLNEQAVAHLATADPVVCVSSGKHELVDPLPDSRDSRPGGEAVLTGVVPWAAQDVPGWLAVPDDHDTAELAVESVHRWWHRDGRQVTPGATRLLVVADVGGAADERTQAWRAGLARFAGETGLTVTVCGLPPGTSKWNSIENRAFASTSHNRPGHPLTTHEATVAIIGPTAAAVPPEVRPDVQGHGNYVVRPE